MREPLPPRPEQGSLSTSYITRVEGCASSNAVERLLLQTAAGAVVAQGVVRCISTFSEEAVPGGFLAAVEGYYVDDIANTSALAAAASASASADGTLLPSIVQMWFVWAVPEDASVPDPNVAAGAAGYGLGGVWAIAPRLAPVQSHPNCSDARQLIPATLPASYYVTDANGTRVRSECGALSADGYACPSYM